MLVFHGVPPPLQGRNEWIAPLLQALCGPFQCVGCRLLGGRRDGACPWIYCSNRWLRATLYKGNCMIFTAASRRPLLCPVVLSYTHQCSILSNVRTKLVRRVVIGLLLLLYKKKWAQNAEEPMLLRQQPFPETCDSGGGGEGGVVKWARSTTPIQARNQTPPTTPHQHNINWCAHACAKKEWKQAMYE